MKTCGVWLSLAPEDDVCAAGYEARHSERKHDNRTLNFIIDGDEEWHKYHARGR
jgi:hypothetical protein